MRRSGNAIAIEDGATLTPENPMHSSPLVSDAMSTPVHAIRADDSLGRCFARMRAHAVHQLPVIDEDGGVIGLVREPDVRAALLSRGPVSIAEVMSSCEATINPGASLREAASRMRLGGVTQLPVVDEGRVVGFITAGDLLRYGRTRSLGTSVDHFLRAA